LISPPLPEGGPIARAHTCDGADLSPPLAWTGIPTGARELAITLHEPDAPGGEFTHWVLYGLPKTVTRLPAGVPRTERLDDPLFASQGVNDHHQIGYRGPCPPPGPPHRYVFTLFALSRPTGLPPGATRAVLLEVLDGAIIETAQLTGTYGRAQSR
jgi:Raf kinase inhibitor-like YbhB/YbcL family protein